MCQRCIKPSRSCKRCVKPATGRWVHLVLNRMPQRLDVTPEELEKMMSLPVFATLPNDYPSLYDSYSEGTLLPPNGKLAKQLGRMAEKLAGIQDDSKSKRSKFSI